MDDELGRAFAARDKRQVVTLLMKQHGQKIFRYAVAMVSDRALAEDIRQQTFADAHRDLAQVVDVAALPRWLYGIAHHRCLDALASRRRWYQRYKNEFPADDEPPGDRPSDDALVALDQAQWASLLRRCVDQLKPRSRAAVLLRYGQGLRYDDVAVIAKERGATVQRRVARALPVLRRCLERKSRGGVR
ncbi:MAG TPA: sigma-70 family RNA polymerase sigma factor [Kofleriaceae bacterium]|nr:sigma-70 family RNA polymerase sigma factor [Kofleriaceae bacterium]